MDDAAYLDALRSRLMGTDWPDFDGSRTDLEIRITGVRRIDGGRWPEVAITLAATPTGGDTLVGEVRRPIDAEWRRLSFYDSPGRYARQLAVDVDHAAWRLCHPPPSRPAPDPPVEPAWRWLLTGLAEYGVVRETAPGRIEVTDDDGNVLTVVVTPEQWATVQREVEELPMGLDEVVSVRRDDEIFLVFDDGELVPSVREELPAVRGSAGERELAATLAADPLARLWFSYGTGPGASRQSGPFVRRRRPDDVPSLVGELWAQQPTSRYPYRDPLPIPVEEFLHVDDAGGAFVLERDRRPVGHVCWVGPRAGFAGAEEMNTACAAAYGCGVGELAFVSAFFVGLPARGRGLGRRLLAAVVADIEAAGRRPCLEVLPVHPAALALYLDTGWHTVLTLHPGWLPPEADEAVQVMVRS